jgi:hypothetical protein
VKKYHSAKTVSEDAWQHDRIGLLPLNPDYEPISVAYHDGPEMVVVGEWVMLILKSFGLSSPYPVASLQIKPCTDLSILISTLPAPRPRKPPWTVGMLAERTTRARRAKAVVSIAQPSCQPSQRLSKRPPQTRRYPEETPLRWTPWQ